MIARTTLALMLAGPAVSAALITSHAAFADTRKSCRDCTSTSTQHDRAASARRGRSERVSSTRRSSRPVCSLPSGADGHDDGLAYDTPRDALGRPLPETTPIALSAGNMAHAWQTGIASWYGGSRWQGQRTSNGQRYDENELTAAHATLPLGSRARVRLIDSAREVVVVITDRPGTHRRIIDLSRGAAAQLGILSQGVARVAVDPL